MVTRKLKKMRIASLVDTTDETPSPVLPTFWSVFFVKLIEMVRLVLLIITAAVILYPIYYLFLQSPPPLPQLDHNEWWGPQPLKDKQDASVRPFQISFGPSNIKDLKDRIKRSRTFTPPMEGIGFEYGFNTAAITSWLKYWSEEYPFEEREKFLNQFPHFKTNIQGLDIHFIRVTPKVPAGVEVVPLLLLHGWPGSVREFYEAIPLLTAVSKDRNFALEIIAPSLPGYGFSDAAVRPGLGAPQMSVVMRNLMHRLGYKKFYVQGGDWGALVGGYLSTLFSEEVLGFHSNMLSSMSTVGTLLEVVGALYPPLIVEDHLADRMYPLTKRFAYLLEETGYMHLQASKPDTVGVALSDSPAGLLAYILEKFSTWTRPDFRSKSDGGLSFRFTKDQLIDNLMMYWSTGCITTSMRLYAETFNNSVRSLNLDLIPTPVPVWAIQAKYELAYQPPFILKQKYTNLLGVTVLDDGGHFLAFELPQVFSEDVLKAVGEFRKLAEKKDKTDL